MTRSALAAELYALSQAYDVRFSLKRTASLQLNKKVDMKLFTDSRTLFDTTMSLCNTTENRLLIDIFCLREAYRNGELRHLGWIRTKHNLADSLTKDVPNSSLHEALRTHRITTQVSQWITKGRISSRKKLGFSATCREKESRPLRCKSPPVFKVT